MILHRGMCLVGLFVLSMAAGPASAAPGQAGLRGDGGPCHAQQGWLRRQVVEAGYPGARMVVWQRGRNLVDEAAGFADIARSRALHDDAIYRIYSMTKPIVSAAVLRLVGEGRARLDDPVSDHLPQFAQLQVQDADGRLRAPARPVTIRHLLTHTAGFPVAEGEALRRREAADLEHSATLADYVERLRAVPLERDPGLRFTYDSIATEVLGRLVEVWSGRELDAYLRETLLEPLGMRDTGFDVPAAERGRIVELSRGGAGGRLQPVDEAHAGDPGTRLRPYPSAAGGLYSTAADYLVFARMLLGRGSLEGREYVPAALVDEMFRDQLPALGAEPAYIDETPGRGFGLGVSVLRDPAALGRAGAPGQVGWTGAASTYFVVDPATQTIGLLLLQHLPNGRSDDLPRVANAFYNHVQQVAAP